MVKKVPAAKRKFKVKPSVMLTAAYTVGKILEANLMMFGNYPNLTIEWLRKLFEDIERMSKKVGVKADEQQRAATGVVRTIHAEALETAITVKNQIERGFKEESERLAELMSLLGYKTNWSKSMNSNNNALLVLLQTFSNHTAELTEELTAHYVSEQLIEKMRIHSEKMNEANITQEILKSESPVITADMNVELNVIYDKVMDICSAGKIVFRKDPIKKAMFSFKRITSQQASAGKTKPDENNTRPGEPANNPEQ